MVSGRIGLAAAAALLVASCGEQTAQQAGGSAQVSVPADTAAVTTTYVNSRANAVAPNLAQHYVDFSFDYPSNWQREPVTPTSSNYIKVYAPRPTGATEPENFAVGSFYGTPDMNTNMQAGPQVMGQLAQQFGRSFAGFQVVDQGESTLNGLRAYQLRFSATPELGGRQRQLWGRAMMVPMPSNPAKGVMIVMLATDSSREVRGVEDVGVRGELPIILRSFRFTDAGGAAAANAPAGDAPVLRPIPDAAPVGPAEAGGKPEADAPQQDGGYVEEPAYDDGGSGKPE